MKVSRYQEFQFPNFCAFQYFERDTLQGGTPQINSLLVPV